MEHHVPHIRFAMNVALPAFIAPQAVSPMHLKFTWSTEIMKRNTDIEDFGVHIITSSKMVLGVGENEVRA